jgi:Uma2 family endonuclease
MKPMGAPESAMTMAFSGFLARFPKIQKAVVTLGPDGHTRYFSGDVRMPDIAIIFRDRLPGGKLPKDAICSFPPDLAVEVLSKSNTRREIAKKLETFFDSGVRLAWVADPGKRTVRVYRAADEFRTLTDDDTLDGEDVLPGFKLSVREWFDAAE